jgi:ribokinase
MSDKKIAVIGSYAVGMTIVGERFPNPGETIQGSNFLMSHGGKGSNQAVAVNRMSRGQCIYGTCLGQDSFGDMAVNLYEEEGMDYKHVRRSEKGLSTGVGLIYVNKEGENEIIIDFAASNEFNENDVDAMMPDIKNCTLLLMQLESDLNTVEYAAKRCAEEGIPFVLNPAPYRPISDELLRNCTFITPNQTEARGILGLAADVEISDEEVARRIREEKGVDNVIMTLGSGGALVQTKEISEIVPGIQVEAVDTTGAGDTFNGAFCVALHEGKSLVEAAKFANVAAGLSVKKMGVIESIPTRDEVDAIYNNLN